MAHEHETRDRHHHGDQAKPAGGIRPHHKVLFAVAVVLALIGLAIYVMSNDEMLQPDGVQQPVPAAP
ncbi:MAG: hypothetical protein JNM94_15645 [Phycisphaerae bacterium]|nr:hypothetical protein [Phycisphaerae bacterium]